MSSLSEAFILQLLAEYFPESHPSLLLGRGDDCAVLRSQNGLCISTDLFLEDIHFRTSYFSSEEVGHKALAVNISDLAAMGVRPLGFNLGLALPKHTCPHWLRGFFAGMARLAKEHNMNLSGGDISRADKLYISITAWGEGISPKQLSQSPSDTPTAQTGPDTNLNHTGRYLTRGGAMPGDSIFLIGDVGLARIGLEELEKNGLDAKKYWPAACAAHLLPRPLVEAGLILTRASQHMRPPVLMDVSDGLARDLPRLLCMNNNQSLNANNSNSYGAQLIFPKSLLHNEVTKHAEANRRNPVHEAWLGGEDYALLGACVPKLLPILKAAVPSLHSIGTVTDDSTLELNGVLMARGCGFDHFRED